MPVTLNKLAKFEQLNECIVKSFSMHSISENRVPAPPHNNGPSKQVRNYKLLSDPFITKGAPKIYRYDGIIPNDPNQTPVIPRDPRPRPAITSRIRSRYDLMEFPVPR